jgi:hypothetical protein
VRKSVTLILVGAIGVVVALAVADALRPDSTSTPAASPPSPTSTTKPEPPTLLGTLRDEAISGFVVYSDQDCRLHSLLLPRMVDDVIRGEGSADTLRCRFDIDGGRIMPERKSEAAGSLSVSDGEIVSGDRVVLNHADLVRAAYLHPNLAGLNRSVRFRIRITGLAAFGVNEPVVAMEINSPHLGPQFLIGLFDGHRVRTVAVRFQGPYRNLFLSNDGALVGAEDGTVMTRTGRTIDPPQGLPASRAIAFSPDDRWVVRVNGVSTYLVGPPEGARPARIIRLPIPARDLDWQPITSGTSVGPPIRR